MCASTPAHTGSRGITKLSTNDNSRTVCGLSLIHILYKYPFADQLMIYAQRPDATACAEFDIWNNRMNRYVRRGAKGIALLDESSGFPRLHYVFDVSDTGCLLYTSRCV